MATARPFMNTIRDTERERWISLAEIKDKDPEGICDYDGKVLLQKEYSPEELLIFLANYYDNVDIDRKNGGTISIPKFYQDCRNAFWLGDDEEPGILLIHKTIQYLNKDRFSADDVWLYGYDRIPRNPYNIELFFTMEEAQKHVDKFDYRYNDPRINLFCLNEVPEMVEFFIALDKLGTVPTFEENRGSNKPRIGYYYRGEE